MDLGETQPVGYMGFINVIIYPGWFVTLFRMLISLFLWSWWGLWLLTYKYFGEVRD